MNLSSIAKLLTFINEELPYTKKSPFTIALFAIVILLNDEVPALAVNWPFIVTSWFKVLTNEAVDANELLTAFKT